MTWTTRVAFLIAVLVWPIHSTASTDIVSDARVTVRAYDASSLTAADREAAIAVASDTLRHANVHIDWVACDAVPPRDACRTTLGPGELAVRFVRLPPPVGRKTNPALGDSLIDTRSQSGVLATIYVDRAAALGAPCNIALGTLVGRAVAHEIAHLLRGNRNHARTGLMRARWSRQSICAGSQIEWVIAAPEAHAMRDAVRTRAARQMAAGVAIGN